MDNNFNENQEVTNEVVNETVNEEPTADYNYDYNYDGAAANEMVEDKDAKTSKICGICSIVAAILSSCCCLGYACIPLSIVAIMKANASKNANGGVMSKDANTGKMCGIIGLVVMGVILVVSFIIGFILGLTGAIGDMNSYY